jgi:glycosyltransferase involved in cell wall biosynthesis
MVNQTTTEDDLSHRHAVAALQDREQDGLSVTIDLRVVKPLVSVVIPTHNRSKLLAEAVESVLQLPCQDYDLEVIVVDDASTDDTASVIAKYPVTYRRISARSAAAARNEGIHTATGDFIAFIDDDDVWLPNNIAPQLQVLMAHPEYGAAHAQTWLADQERRSVGEPSPGGPLSSGWIFLDLLNYWPQIGTLVVRSCVAREIGDMDSKLQSEEEWDWILRIAQHHQIARVAQPVMLYRQRFEDEELRWKRSRFTIKVFRRRVRHFPFRQRLGLQRILWRHRGWYCDKFVHEARSYKEKGQRAKVLRCLYYAVRTSPLHAVKGVHSNWRR